MRRRAVGALLGALAGSGGCAPPGTAVPAPDARTLVCEPLTLAAGEVRAKPVACTDELPGNSEGRVGDWLLQSSALTVVVRNPYEGLSLVGGPGGGVIDATAVGWRDRLREVVPLIAGLPLNPHSLEAGVDEGGAWLRLEGSSASTPGLSGTPGVEGEVVYRLEPDEGVLRIEGADALWVQGEHGTTALGGAVYHTGLAVISDATGWTRTDGARVLEGATALAIGPWPEVHSLAWDQPRASGSCAGDRVEVLAADGEVLAWLPPDYDSPLPPGAAALVCTAESSADGAPTPPGEGQSLSPGAYGALWVRAVDHTGRERPVRVTVDGVPYAVPPGGGAVPTGAGSFAVEVDHGPTWTRWAGEVTVEGDSFLELELRPRMDTEGWALLDLRREAWPSRHSQTLPEDDLALAAAAGFSFAVATPWGEIGEDDVSDWALGWIRAEAGNFTEGEGGEVGAWTWPWSSSRRQSGHGAPDPTGLGAADLLTLAMGPNDPNRVGLVSAGWVAQAGEPSAWSPGPDALLLEGLEELDALFVLLERGVRVAVAGPLTWSPVDDSALPSSAALQRGLMEGRTVASTGPLLRLEAVGAPLPLGVHARGRLETTEDHRLDQLELWVDGALARVWPLSPGEGSRVDEQWLLPEGRWALLVARGEDWAVSAPLWLDAP